MERHGWKGKEKKGKIFVLFLDFLTLMIALREQAPELTRDSLNTGERGGPLSSAKCWSPLFAPVRD